MLKTVLDVVAALKVYFFAGWQYVGIVTSIATFTVLINQYRESGALPGVEVLYAAALMLVVVACTIALGYAFFHTINKRENNINLKNSPYLCETLESINNRLDNIEKRL